jgi:hypothetical protein
MLKDVTARAVIETLGEHGIPYKWNQSEQVITLIDTGSIILVRSLTNSDALRGTNLAWFGVDELTYTNEGSWMQLEARLRDPKAGSYCGFGVWTPKGTDWVYRRFIDSTSPQYRAITAKPFENEYVLNHKPLYYDLLKNSYCDSEYRQEVLGDYITEDHNRVYACFEPKIHLASITRDLSSPLLWAFDFNVDPMCSIVAQRFADSVKILDEVVLRRSGTEEMCLEFANRYGDHPMPIKIYGDASGNARSTKGASDYDIVRSTLTKCLTSSFMLTVPKQNPKVLDRISLVNSLLRNASGHQRLTVSRGCKELIKDLMLLRFKAGSSIVDKTTDPDRSHLADALGYLIWQEYSQTRVLGEQSQRLL